MRVQKFRKLVTWPRPRLRRRVYGPYAGGSVLYVCSKFEVESSNRSKVKRGSHNFKIALPDTGHAHLGAVMWSETLSLRTRPLWDQKSRSWSCYFGLGLKNFVLLHHCLGVTLGFVRRSCVSTMYVPNSKRVGVFVQKL